MFESHKKTVCSGLAFVLVLTLIILSAGAAFCDNTMGFNSSGVSEKMINASFWIDRLKAPDEVIMSQEEVAAFSEAIKHTPKTYCTDITEYPPMITAEKLRATVDPANNIRKKGYVGDKLPDENYIAALAAQCNAAAIHGINIVRFAIVSKQTFLRAMPTDDPSYDEPNDSEFDMYIETLLRVWEPLAILHTSLDGAWYYAVSPSASGWVKASDVAITDRETLKKYLAKDFVIVTGSRIAVSRDPNKPRTEYIMGTRFPLADDHAAIDGVTSDYSYVALLPERDSGGQLAEAKIRIPRGMDVHRGYLPYTQRNILTQAFKMLGERYGWGGSYYEWDCSSFIRDIYMTMGFELPRNSGVQIRIKSPISLNVSKVPDKRKDRIIISLPAGAILQMPGHTTLYLGRYNGKPYIIHSAYAYGGSGKGGAEGRIKMNSVVISDLNITRKNKTTFLHNISNITSIDGRK
jgi:hypothetical protein